MSFKKVKKLGQQSVLVASLTAATAFGAIAQSNDNNAHHNGDKDKAAKPKIENVNDNEDNNDSNDLKLPEATPYANSGEAARQSWKGTRFAIHVEQNPHDKYSGEDYANNFIEAFADPNRVGGTGIPVQASTYDEGGAKYTTYVSFYIDGLRRGYDFNGEENVMVFRISELKQVVPMVVQDYIEMARREGFTPALIDLDQDGKPRLMPPEKVARILSEVAPTLAPGY